MALREEVQKEIADIVQKALTEKGFSVRRHTPFTTWVSSYRKTYSIIRGEEGHTLDYEVVVKRMAP